MKLEAKEKIQELKQNIESQEKELNVSSTKIIVFLSILELSFRQSEKVDSPKRYKSLSTLDN